NAGAGECAVDAPERLDADEIAQDEHVQRDLELQLVVDLLCGVRASPRLVVLHDPARTERIDVDSVDLAAQVDVLAKVEPALQLGRRAVRAEAHLEASRQQLERRCRLVAHEALEIAPQALLQLRRLKLRELQADAAAQRVVEAAAEESDSLLDVL